MIKASIISQKYFHSENTTVCIIETRIEINCGTVIVLERTFKGKAKKHPDDSYNSYVGDILAESRAFEKLYKFFYKLAIDLRDAVYKQFECLHDVSIKYKGLIKSEQTQQEWEELVNSAERRRKYRENV